MRDSITDEVPFVLPVEMMFIIKSFITIEGICTKLDPEFNYYTYLQPLLTETFMDTVNIQKFALDMSQVPGQLKDIGNTLYTIEKNQYDKL